MQESSGHRPSDVGLPRTSLSGAGGLDKEERGKPSPLDISLNQSKESRSDRHKRVSGSIRNLSHQSVVFNFVESCFVFVH
mgnify:FL=1